MTDTRPQSSASIVERLRQIERAGDLPPRGHVALAKEAAAEIERLRALLVRYQAANYIPEDCDLYAETKRALEGVKG